MIPIYQMLLRMAIHDLEIIIENAKSDLSESEEFQATKTMSNVNDPRLQQLKIETECVERFFIKK